MWDIRAAPLQLLAREGGMSFCCGGSDGGDEPPQLHLFCDPHPAQVGPPGCLSPRYQHRQFSGWSRSRHIWEKLFI